MSKTNETAPVTVSLKLTKAHQAHLRELAEHLSIDFDMLICSQILEGLAMWLNDIPLLHELKTIRKFKSPSSSTELKIHPFVLGIVERSATLIGLPVEEVIAFHASGFAEISLDLKKDLIDDLKNEEYSGDLLMDILPYATDALRLSYCLNTNINPYYMMLGKHLSHYNDIA